MYRLEAQQVHFSLFVIKLITYVAEIGAEVSIAPSSTVTYNYPETSISEIELIPHILPTTTTVLKNVMVETPLIPTSVVSSNLGYEISISKTNGPSLVTASSPVTTRSSNTIPPDNVDLETTKDDDSQSTTNFLTNLPAELLSLIAIGISSASFCCVTLLLVGHLLLSCRSRQKSAHIQDEALRTATLQRPLGDAIRDSFQLTSTVIENPTLKEVPPVTCAEHENLSVNGGKRYSVI